MNSAEYVKNLIIQQKSQGIPLQQVTWNAALACEGMPYVFGASGQDCTPAYRRQAYAKHGSDHPTIKKACKNFDGSGTCSGCKWYPGGKRVMCFDCRGFTYDMLYLVYGWKLQGGGCTSQWNTESNWKAKGRVSDGIPKDTLVCLFYSKDNKENVWEHTGFGLNGETVECSAGVQHFTSMNKKWTHWGVPACVGYEPEPVPQGYAEVIEKQVALRKDASKSATIIMRIKTGERVKLETPPKDWDYVSYSSKSGYMMREFLREKGTTATVTGKRVALRVDPCTRAKVIMRIDTGKTVKIEPYPESAWDYVSYNGKYGWMMKEFLKEG